MASVRQWELLDRYGPWCTLAVSVAMILAIIFFIFFRCNAIFAMGPTYDCAIGHLGTGDLEILIRSDDDLACAKELIVKSYEAN